MSKKFSVPRGTSDILPADSLQWQKLEAVSRQVLTIYHYQEIRTPIFEESELFARSMGQTSDVVNKQMLSLAAQKSDDKEALTLSGLSLRPENTASVVRSYIENSLDRKEQLSKLFYIGPMFRGERPQKGRLRQFHQIGAEAIGPQSAHPLLDAEMIALSVHILKALGLKNFKCVINTLGTAKDKDNFSKYLKKSLKPHASNLSEYSQLRLERNVFRILDSKDNKDQKILKEIQIGSDHLADESRTYYENVKAALVNLDVAFEESPYLVRGLDYYTHTVFEISDDSLGSQNALGAGGRYSHLVEQLGGPKVDAVGFALGIERILLASGESSENCIPLDVFLVALNEDALAKGFHFVNQIRQSGISCDMSYKLGSVKSQMRQANKYQAKKVILLGEEEIKNETVMLKDMVKGEQEAVCIRNLKGLIDELKK